MSRAKSENPAAPKSVSPERIERLKKVIDATGFSQKAFAASVGTSETNLSDILNGRTGITISLAEKIEGRFRIDPSWLIFGPDPLRTKEFRMANEVTAMAIRLNEKFGPIWRDASVDDLEEGDVITFDVEEEGRKIRRLGRVGTLEGVQFVASLTRPGDPPIPLRSGKLLKVWRLRGVRLP